MTNWTVDDPSVLTVTGNALNGVFTAMRSGIARITVTKYRFPASAK